MRWLLLLPLIVSSPLHGQDKKTQPPIKVVPYAGGQVDYAKQVLPILENKCLTCHSGSIKKGRLELSSVETMLRGGKTGPAIVPGKPDASQLIKLAGRTGTPTMPPKTMSR